MRRQLIDGAVVESDNAIREGSRIHGYGTVIKVREHVKPDRQLCAGCEDDFYNDHNPHGVKECWHFKTAQVVTKIGHSSIHVPNGPDTIMRGTLSCWHGVCK